MDPAVFGVMMRRPSTPPPLRAHHSDLVPSEDKNPTRSDHNRHAVPAPPARPVAGPRHAARASTRDNLVSGAGRGLEAMWGGPASSAPDCKDPKEY
eukprot:366399-Chlamydomonas_euryale.AAC.28